MVSEKRPALSHLLLSQRLYRFIRELSYCAMQRRWFFALMTTALISVVILATHYLFTFNVKIAPIHSWNIIKRNSISGHNTTEGADQIENNVTSEGREDRNTLDKADVEREFEKQWFRMQRARVDWKALLVPCGYVNSVTNRTMIGWGKINATSINKSYLDYMEIRPAGQFSRIFIRTRTKDGRNKTIGGDFWMVIFSGPANVTATVFDHNNGSYEAMALLVDPGFYTIIAIIERSLCEGYREPKPSFYTYYMKRHYLWLYNLFEEIAPIPPRRFYVWGRIDNTKIRFHVVQSRDDVGKRLRSVFRHRPCATNCRSIWTGLGRWIGKSWKPYLETDDHDLNMIQVAKERRNPLETLYIVGDSTNRMFSQEYFHRKQLCHGKKIWKRCTWYQQKIFPLEKTPNPKAVKFSERYGNVSERFRFDVILDSIRHAFQTEGMNSSRSLLILHYNTHQTKYLTFSQWKKLIPEVITLLKNRRKLFGSEAQVVWKTMTAIGYTGAFYQIEGMYHTAFRTRLFAAYALSQMCKAGFEIYDVFPMSASTLIGARDRVHFLPGVFPKAMEALTWWYLSNDTQKTTDICFRDVA